MLGPTFALMIGKRDFPITGLVRYAMRNAREERGFAFKNAMHWNPMSVFSFPANNPGARGFPTSDTIQKGTPEGSPGGGSKRPVNKPVRCDRPEVASDLTTRQSPEIRETLVIEVAVSIFRDSLQSARRDIELCVARAVFVPTMTKHRSHQPQ